MNRERGKDRERERHRERGTSTAKGMSAGCRDFAAFIMDQPGAIVRMLSRR